MISPAVPELTEENLGEAVDHRTDSLPTLRALGPPDLVHLNRQTTKGTFRAIGIYHHVTGVDASSSASLAAYINTLTYKDSSQAPGTKVAEGLYCRLDMRVQVKIPGSVESYGVDDRGERHVANDELWQEAYISSILRAYNFADDGGGEAIRRVVGLRRFNPIPTLESEQRFLAAADAVFFKDANETGWQLGSNSTVQAPTNVCNHLTDGLLAYFETTGRYEAGIELLEKLQKRNMEVTVLLARILFMAHQEVRAIRELRDGLLHENMSYTLLDAQAEFLLRKGQEEDDPIRKKEILEMALACADRSTVAAPGEFQPWARLAQVYVALEDWSHVLSVLNSCPMFTHHDRDMPAVPEPKDIFLPILAESRLDEINMDSEGQLDQIDPTLVGLRASLYRGTFKAAYQILAQVTAKIGWDQLLKIRSSVFVMEDEYRHELMDQSAHQRNPSTEGLRSVTDRDTEDSDSGGDQDSEDQDSENDSEMGTDKESRERGDLFSQSVDVSLTEPEVPSPSHTPVPTASDLTTSSDEGAHRTLQKKLSNLSIRSHTDPKTLDSAKTDATREADDDGKDEKRVQWPQRLSSPTEASPVALSGDAETTTPASAHPSMNTAVSPNGINGNSNDSSSSHGNNNNNSSSSKNGSKGPRTPLSATSSDSPPSLSATSKKTSAKLYSKRLCERWLDSLFMVLYEDLRVYTIWRTQMAQYKAQSIQYRKSPEEWEILGHLAERLQHPKESLEAYRSVLASRFSPRAMASLLRSAEGDDVPSGGGAGHGSIGGGNTPQTVMSYLLRLIAWQYRWYSEFSPDLFRSVRRLVEAQGATKAHYLVQAGRLPEPVLGLTQTYLTLCATYQTDGSDR